jgi:hypothetical protein
MQETDAGKHPVAGILLCCKNLNILKSILMLPDAEVKLIFITIGDVLENYIILLCRRIYGKYPNFAAAI